MCGDDPGRLPKPHPDNAEFICKELHVSPEETVMIGDTSTDIAFAKVSYGLKTSQFYVLSNIINCNSGNSGENDRPLTFSINFCLKWFNLKKRKQYTLCIIFVVLVF